MSTTFPQVRDYFTPILAGAAIAIVGILPWAMLAPINARLRPDLPWAALAIALFLAIFIAWLHGIGAPSAAREARRYRLRLWRPTPSAWTRAGLGPTSAILSILVVLYALWIAFAHGNPSPDLSPYPTTMYRVSIVVMGAIVSGVVEEVAFRGYLQTGLERFGAGPAILVTSLVFVLFHGVHGWQSLLLLGPGLFIASVLYGLLAYHTGSIVPGMIMHVLGDLSFTLVGRLGGDLSLLVAPT